MTPVNLQIQIQAMAIMVRIEGMKADNQQRVHREEYAANTELDFERMACELDGLQQQVSHE